MTNAIRAQEICDLIQNLKKIEQDKAAMCLLYDKTTDQNVIKAEMGTNASKRILLQITNTCS